MADVRLADGGLETSLMFHQDIELPLFAAFPLVLETEGRAALRAYWEPYLAIAREYVVPFVVDTATWRANPDWASQLGFSADDLREANRRAAAFARELVAEVGQATVNGVVGPRGDGYVVDDVMSAERAADYHSLQVEALASADVDQVAALTLTYPQEAIGFLDAASAVDLPAIVSFTVETDGRLPNGQRLRDAIELVDEATNGAARGFMVNCAHPTHFEAVLDGPWVERIHGLRANASTRSHAELDEADTLDEGDPHDLGARYAALAAKLPRLNVLGGCCGTDHRHVEKIAECCVPMMRSVVEVA